MPLLLLLAIFVLVPATELYLLIEVGSEIGALSTIWRRLDGAPSGSCGDVPRTRTA